VLAGLLAVSTGNKMERAGGARSEDSQAACRVKEMAGSPRTRVKRRQGLALVMVSSGTGRLFGCALCGSQAGDLARAHVPLRIGMGRANSVLSQVKAVVVPCNVQPFRLPLPT
jgi:hypothetical protein